MKFTQEELSRFENLDAVEKELFSGEEITAIHKRAERRAKIRRTMSESISKTVASYMARENIGFNELTRRLNMSSATISKILRGDANLTLDTLAVISEVLHLNPTIEFK